MATVWHSQEDEFEFDESQWLELLSPELLLVLGVILLVVLLVAILLVWFVVRRLRRNSTVRRWAATARTQTLPPGPMRDLGQLRVQVQEIRDRTRAAVTAAEQRGAWRTAPADLPTLAARLEETSAALEERLAVHARQPEDRVREALPELREQVRLMEESEGTLHRGLELASLPSDTQDMRQLQQQLDDEVVALQAYRDAYREFRDGNP